MSIDWKAIAEKLSPIETITEPRQLTKLSQDYYHFSPILTVQLQNKRGDMLVRPDNEAQVLQVAQLCYQHKIPLTVRGAGTGNYGQCMPLEGGIILDMTKLNHIPWIKPGNACVEPGVRMAAFDKEAKKIGWELRMAPSTYHTATIGGFIGGGSAGMGSINYGQTRDRGNLQAVRVVTLEAEPKVITLQGDEVQKINHAYGTNGIITELQIPLAPALPWTEMTVLFDEFMVAAEFGQALSDSDGISKKLVSIHADPIPTYFQALKHYLQPGKHCALLMVCQYDLAAVKALVEEYGGEISYEKTPEGTAKGLSLLEFTWNHTTLLARNLDPNLTYLQTFYFTLERVKHCYEHFGDEVMIHLEFLRFAGKAIPAGIQLVRFSSEKRLAEIIRYHEELGAGIANPHTYILEDGGRKVVDLEQLQFKQLVDPEGLMNPGKMKAWSHA